ncbi:SDR family NAD(P)-dependent oxidoreductase [Bacillus vallismortis]|uniref:SDR family NAD(P)-dependent oxidoreductase n=1 Tax=Bacillus vallismortis TaxID=72361 RepID=UPI0002883470|nr:SDR family NAD(P)-dependent oxidoreductase [Bacillus vallismortis]MBG9769635.1 3-ketoacyl-ACP reductase [Bacillus vallismortis]MEC1268462.1 SDR family NAD(P)-dependent oxidoreductase [Bacillus vallismortis]QAV07268.1 KR domain-containing protein [Bacillus vallismortis]
MNVMNKIALVTGGGTGIGRAASMELAKRGAIVAVNYSRSQSEAEETVEMIQKSGGQAFAIRTNVSKEREVQDMVQSIVKTYGTIDVLVNNASMTRHIPMDDLEAATEDVWDELYAVNVKGMFFCARAVVPFMKKSKAGAIVNVGSIAGITGAGSSMPYAVSKSAVHGLTKSLAHALAPEIRVNGVAPGAVATRWWAGQEEKMKSMIGTLPLQRMAESDDVAKLICSLVEQESLTGQIITVDSGQTL